MAYQGIFFPYLEALIRLVYPSRCEACRSVLDLQEVYLCKPCTVRLEGLLIPYQDRLLPHSLTSVDDASALFLYEPPLQQLLHAAKFKRKTWLFEALSTELVAWASALSGEQRYDALIPAPMHFAKRLQRHFNQTEILATCLSQAIQVPVEKILRRKWQAFASQRLLSRERRLEKIQGSMSVKFRNKIKGRSFLLIDDIMTTGATVNEMAKILKHYGAARTDVLTLAYTPRTGKSS